MKPKIDQIEKASFFFFLFFNHFSEFVRIINETGIITVRIFVIDERFIETPRYDYFIFLLETNFFLHNYPIAFSQKKNSLFFTLAIEFF